jgi:hypothetical protein
VLSFYTRVLPAKGSYVVVAIGAAGAREVTNLPDLASVDKAVQRLSAANLNVFLAIGSYGQHTRASGNTPSTGGRKDPKSKRCLYLDLDPQEFGDKGNALKELSAFCKATGFPGPSIYVDSGRGIHAYWTFDRDLDVAAWRALAGKLKEKCLSAGFKVDPVVTSDAARILRVPGTLNHKSSPPIACRVLKDTGRDFDPAALLRALVPVPAAGSAVAALASLVDADDLGSLPASAYPNVPYFASEIERKCNVMKEACDTGGAQHTEPKWRQLMALLSFCEDGEAYVEKISAGHAGYNAEKTHIKWTQVLQQKATGAVKPILCSTLSAHKPSLCAGCPFNGNIKTPMVLGKLEATSYLSGNYRMGDYSVERKIKDATPELPAVYTLAFPYRIANVEVTEVGEHLRQIAMECMGKKRTHHLEFDGSLLATQGDSLGLTMFNAGLNVSGEHITEFKKIMSVWLRKMEDVKNNVRIEQSGLGWGTRGGKHVFAAGGKVFDGAIEHDFIHPDKKMVANYSPKGSPDVWKKAASVLIRDPRQAAVCTLLTAFAAPLVCFSSVKGLTFSVYSAGSGTGKSAVLRTAQSVWGHPTNGMAMLDDTQLSVINKLGFLNTIPAYWDELRSGESLVAFVKTLFTLGQGREKSRLTSSIKQQNTSTWDTLITLASNERLADHVDRLIRNTDAGRLRLFEVTMPGLTTPDPAMKKVFSDLENNYGHAGVEWGKWLVVNRQLASDTVQKMQIAIGSLQKDNNERFWIAFVALILSTAALVSKAGILQVDIPKLKQWLVSQLMAQQSGVEQNYHTPADAAVASISGFIDAHRMQMLVVDKANIAKGEMRNILTPVTQLPREQVLIQRGIEDKIVKIDLVEWRKWVSDSLKHSPTTLWGELTKLRGFQQKRAVLDAGLQNSSNTRKQVIEVDLALAGLDIGD